MPLYFQHFDGDSSKLGMSDKNSAKRDTQPLNGHDLTHKCSLGGIPRDHLVEKILRVWKKPGCEEIFFLKDEVECGITQPSSRIAFFYCFDLLELMALHDDILSSSSWAIGKKWANQSSKQSIKQDFDSMMTAAQRAAVVKMGMFAQNRAQYIKNWPGYQGFKFEKTP